MMNQKNFQVTDELAGKRLDVLVSAEADISRSRAAELIKEGLVLVDGRVEKASFKADIGAEISVEIPEIADIPLEPEDLGLEIVYEDAHVVVVNKPSGMVVHPSLGHDRATLVNGLLFALSGLSSINGKRRPGIVHRIDKDTSGLLMIAKNDIAHEALAKQLKEKTAKREYIALVHGVIEHEKGKIDAPIGRDVRDRMKYQVTGSGKESVTHFEVMKRYEDYTLIKCRLETGRTHQIRVHMRYIEHPIVGDPFYGPRKTIKSEFGQFLHARTLGFEHPVTGEFLEFEAGLPAEFEKLLGELDEN